MIERAELIHRRLGSELRAAREEKGWTLDEVAEALNISAATVSRRENGVTTMSIKALAAHCNLLECDPLELLRWAIRWADAN